MSQQRTRLLSLTSSGKSTDKFSQSTEEQLPEGILKKKRANIAGMMNFHYRILVLKQI